ncbi:hypothetical protein THTE_4391 [Thermogutta terrifontis]|uniref:Uncharacterized protein n=1 Tax=Thermogutta terrifontis TaxID=1331910 RepID=A0A286RM09_9BACT|nr:hypothetical protein THTE_4391 [Thermogutta terrifontis]
MGIWLSWLGRNPPAAVDFLQIVRQIKRAKGRLACTGEGKPGIMWPREDRTTPGEYTHG